MKGALAMMPNKVYTTTTTTKKKKIDSENIIKCILYLYINI